jgi:hypothetical protein
MQKEKMGKPPGKNVETGVLLEFVIRGNKAKQENFKKL